MLIHVGNDVRLSAFGLKAKLNGDLKLVQDKSGLDLTIGVETAGRNIDLAVEVETGFVLHQFEIAIELRFMCGSPRSD
jgi:hypothetical protein